jgi:hypothetical protein
MNLYEMFIYKLRAMQVQGFKHSEIIDVWKTEMPEIIDFLDKSLLVAILKKDKKHIHVIRRQRQHLKTLDKTINKGLLE